MKLLTDFIFVTGMVVLLIILFSIYKNQKKELPQKILFFLFLVLFFLTVNFYAYLHRIKLLYVATILFEDPVEWLIGPILLVYVKSIFSKENNLIKNNLGHFIPFGIYFIVVSIPLFLTYLSGGRPFPHLKYLEENYETALFIIQAPYLLFYALLALWFLNKYRRSLKQNYSNLLEKDIAWVKYLLIGVVMIAMVDISTTIYELAFGEFDWDTGHITIVAMIFMIVFLGYYGSSQSQILLPDFILNETNDPVFEKEKTSKSHSLSNTDISEIERLKNRLEEVLKNEKPYLNEDLTLGTLAKMLPTTDKKLSALLNHHVEITFYDLINSYRVEEVKSRMANSDFENYTLIAIAYDSGFKSKTSFNRIFKKMVGCSPSEYKMKNVEKT